MDFAPFYLSIKLALTTTLILFAVGVPVAYALAFARWPGKVLVEALVGLPLVLPPSVLGFYLLLAFSPQHAFGSFLENYFNVRLVFTFPGLVVASVIYSLPFMIQPIQNGFRSVPVALTEAAYTLGKSRFTTLTKVLLPNMKGALVTACMLTFAHTIGEFGVVLMVGGNIPGETRVVSVTLYDEVEAMNYQQANAYAAVLLVFSFLVLVGVYLVSHRAYKVDLYHD